MWISSCCIVCVYQQNTKVKQLFSLLTYENSHSPAMKQVILIRGVDNLVEKINIIQNKQECQTMEYDIQFICCSCKITEIERKDKVVALTIIIGDFILTWASHEQNNRETCFIHLYKATLINEWDNIMFINDWKKWISFWLKQILTVVIMCMYWCLQC